MNFKIIVVFLLFTGAVTVFGQKIDSRSTNDSAHNSLINKKLAFQYETGYNFAGRSFIPIVFSLKYHLSDKTALRLSVELNPGEGGFGRMNMNDNRINHERFDHHGTDPEHYNFTLNYMLYPAPKADINLFFGLGPRFGFGSEHFGNPGYRPENMENYNSQKPGNSSWSIGLSGVIGAEWFVSRSISLFTEYDAAFSYRQRDYWEVDLSVPPGPNSMKEMESSEYLFTDLSARLGFSIYFDSPF